MATKLELLCSIYHQPLRHLLQDLVTKNFSTGEKKLVREMENYGNFHKECVT